MQRRIEISTDNLRFDKIKLNRLLRKSANMGLADAKKTVDSLLDDGVVSVFVDESEAREFASLVSKLGLAAKVHAN